MTPQYIILHHSLTKDGSEVSWGAIRRYHTQTNGWLDIGYHAGIERVGDSYEVLLGRAWDQAGSHAKEVGMNGKSLGICLVGDFDLSPPPPAQWHKALDLVRRLQRTFSIPAGNVMGHREVGFMAGFDWRIGQYKSCPGKMFDMQAFRAELA